MIKQRIAYDEYVEYRLKIFRAEGSYIWDDKGKKYIDFTSGWNVTNLGWNHPEIAKAITEQLEKNAYAPLWGSDEMQETYAQELTGSLPTELDTCVKATSGTEAVEEAIKIARAATGRKKIIGFAGTYHGQLFASMALAFPLETTQDIAPLVPEIIQVPYPQSNLDSFLEAFEKLIAKKDVAALVTEAGIVTGGGTVFIAPKGYLSAVRKLTEKYGTLLIVDEVGTGFSRTGKLFAIEHEKVVPDMVALAKAIANGAGVLGAVVGKREIIEPSIPATNLTSTFGWTPLSCAAALKTLQLHKREKVWEQVAKKGEYLLEKLKSKLKNNPHIVEIRGLGMEVGIELKGSKEMYNTILENAAKKGLQVIGNTENVIQLMPPLTISQEDLDKGIEILVESFM